MKKLSEVDFGFDLPSDDRDVHALASADVGHELQTCTHYERHPSSTVTSFMFGMLGGIRMRNKGNAFKGIKRNAEQEKLDFPPMTSSSWSSYALQASKGAEQARLDAKLAMDDAANFSMIAQSSADQAKAALIQAQQMAKASVADSPTLRPFIHLCDDIAKYIRKHPKRADGDAMIQLRAFCGGLTAYVDRATRDGAASTAQGLGFKFYDAPPAELPQSPMWPPATPIFRAPLSGPEPVLPDSLCWRSSRKGHMEGCPQWVAEGAARQAAEAAADKVEPEEKDGLLMGMAMPEPLLLLRAFQRPCVQVKPSTNLRCRGSDFI